MVAPIQIGNGINIGPGVSVGSSFTPGPTPPTVPTLNAWIFDSNYLGPALGIGQAGSWNSAGTGPADMEVYAENPEDSIALGVLPNGVGSLQDYASKIMFTVYIATEDSYDIPLHLASIGAAYRAVSLNNALGTDGDSWGYRQDGTIQYNGNQIATGMPTYGPLDYIDVAVDLTVGLAWVRVNGGAWNGGGADPVTQTNGIYIPTASPLYPAVNPGAQSYIDAMDISMYTYSIPSGYTAI